MKSSEIRNKWLEFFKSKDHYVLEPVSLIPVNDNSLLWINSGVATLKPYFEGKKNPPSPRITNSQKSIRTNDIENVGVTSRHHTFFEMLGNFSIGDYFKKESIEMAWEFLTSPEWLDINKTKLFVTYYEDDKEAKDIWINKTDINPKHLISMGKDTNFWDIGLGPCGPSTEIFYDRGEKFDKRGIEILEKDLENDRYVELWNIVFSQFNNDGNKNYKPLPRKNIDTGAGLERIASILQDTPTNFETDLFMPIIKEIEKHTKLKYKIDSYFSKDKKDIEINKSFKIIADHLRSTVFAISDGQDPSNIGRGYVIRRLIRRSLTIASVNLDIKLNGTFFSSLVNIVYDIMKDYYPYLKNELKRVKNIFDKEEISFIEIIDKANELILKDKNFNAKKAFFIFESHGIPYDLSRSICDSHAIRIDKEEFNKLFKKHQSLARSNQKDQKGMNIQDDNIEFYNSLQSEFLGYTKLELESTIIGLIENDKQSKTLSKEGIIVLDKTSFYATSGGQEHDFGVITTKDFEFVVSDVIKHANGLFLHKGKVTKGSIKLNDKVKSSVDKQIRKNSSINHSATHLMFYSLENILKNDLPQAGAFYNKDKFRFDFKFNDKFEIEELKNKLEKETLKLINEDLKQVTKELKFNDAIKEGAKFMKDETYGPVVRVVKFGNKIIDLCGGTHILSSKEIEDIIITNFESKGSNIYRIEGLTTTLRINNWKKLELDKWQKEIDSIIDKYKLLNSKNKTLDIIIDNFNYAKKNLNLNEAINLFWLFQKEEHKFRNSLKDKIIQKQIKEINLEKASSIIENKNVYNVKLNNLDLKYLRDIYVQLIPKIESNILLLSSSNEKITNFILGVNKKNQICDFAKPLNSLRNKFDIKGGGGPQMIQAIIETKQFDEIIKSIIREC